MATFLDWFASHNTLVIQSLAAVVALLILFLIFRLLFATNQETVAAKNVTYTQLEEKLNQLLEQQSQMKISVIAAAKPIEDILGDDAMAALSGDSGSVESAAAEGAAMAQQAAELSRLKAEISTLKDSVKRKENELIDAKDQAQKSINTAQQDAKLDDLSGKLTGYEQEINALKNRLSDYEIIAEDIADLQQLKKENQELKNKLAGAVTATPSGETQSESSIEPKVDESAAELFAELGQRNSEAAVEQQASESETTAETEVESAPETVAAAEEVVPDDIFAAANNVLNESIADSEPEEETMPEAKASGELDNAEAREVSKDVKKEDKILLDEFEKHFAKDED